MKTQIIFFIVLMGIFCKSQEIISRNSKDVKIKSLTKDISLSGKDFVEITNHSDYTYIINSKGFLGGGDIYENDSIRFLPTHIVNVSYSNWNKNECRERLLIIPKHSSIKAYLYLIRDHDVYLFDNNKKYKISYRAEHTLDSPYYYGCEEYVDSLVAKGYKIYEGVIKDKKPLITKYIQ